MAGISSGRRNPDHIRSQASQRSEEGAVYRAAKGWAMRNFEQSSGAGSSLKESRADGIIHRLDATGMIESIDRGSPMPAAAFVMLRRLPSPCPPGPVLSRLREGGRYS